MPLRSSTKILIGAIVVTGIGYLGFQVVPTEIIKRQSFPEIQPGDVNVVGVDTKAGYYIVVANQVAQLVIGTQSNFEAPEKEGGDDSQKRRIPLRDMLRAMQGDEAAMGKFVMSLNEISEAGLPAQPIVWPAEDLQRALDGDAKLRAKLISDISVNLDGSPAQTLRVGAVQEGIVIESPVPVTFGKGANRKTVTGWIREEFRPRFLRKLEQTLAEKSNLTRELIRAYYIAAAQEMLKDPGGLEDVEASLRSRIDPARLKRMAELPEKMLNSITIILTENQIVDGSYARNTAETGKPTYDMTLNLNEDGRKRLWHYSATHQQQQLLVVWDGIAIAAPRIQGPIPFSEVQIRKIPDEGLVQDTLDAIRRSSTETKSKP